MASAYKSTLRDDDDISDSDDMFGDGSVGSSGTLQEDSSSTEESGNETSSETAQKQTATSTQPSTTELRNRILMLTSRGVSHRHRHLMTDLHSLLPHTYKDTKLDTKSNNNYNSALNALADLHSCNYIFFLEARKNGQDLYLWTAKAPNGPTIKFNVSNIHTMAELGFGGNCLKGGRGIVVFDKSFDNSLSGYEHRTLIREMLRGIFCVPSKGIRGSKPFIDRVIGLYGLDGKIWVRIYEIREGENKAPDVSSTQPGSDVTLVEIGPRFVLTPIIILEGSFGGPVIFENKQYVSPNQIRREARVHKAGRYADRRSMGQDLVTKKKNLGLQSGGKRKVSELDDSQLFS